MEGVYEEYDDWDYPDYDDEDEDDLADSSNNPCSRCGPWCEHWAGDDLCNLAIEQLAAEYESYTRDCVVENVPCPVCGVLLTEYQIPLVDELWVWPGNLNPVIGLDVYAAIGAPKGELHSQDRVYHVWLGEGEHRREQLIRLGTGAFADDIPF